MILRNEWKDSHADSKQSILGKYSKRLNDDPILDSERALFMLSQRTRKREKRARERERDRERERERETERERTRENESLFVFSRR